MEERGHMWKEGGVDKGLPVIGIASFTNRGHLLSARIAGCFQGEYEFWERGGSLRDWCRDCFDTAEGLIFIGACGIAVRAIAPFLRGKAEDPAVLVIDEAGNYVISLLSGHLGGANELARRVADRIGAQPVITTASDVNGRIAIDVFAKKNDLAIASMKDAKTIAASLLQGSRVGVLCTGTVLGPIPPELLLLPALREGPFGEGLSDPLGKRPGDGDSDLRADSSGDEMPDLPERIPGERDPDSREIPGGQVDHLVWISEYPPDAGQTAQYLRSPSGTVLSLIPRNVVLGIGCRKGKTAGEIEAVVQEAVARAGIAPQAVAAAATIDLKKGEPGLLDFCGQHRIPLFSYPPGELEQVEGAFHASDFVREVTGVDNVCERAALLAARQLGGKNGEAAGAELIGRKYARNGVTAALAAWEWRVCFEK